MSDVNDIFMRKPWVNTVAGLATGTDYSVTPYADSLSAATGTGLSNYVITYVNGSLQITQVALPPVGLLDSDTVTDVNGLSNYAITYTNGSLQITLAAFPPSLPDMISNRNIDTMAYLQSLFMLNDVDLETGIECNKSTTYAISAKKCVTSNTGSVPRVIDGGINFNFIGTSLNEH